MAEITLEGIPASPGIVEGPLYVYKPPDLSIPEREPGPPERELALFTQATQTASLELKEIYESVIKLTGEEKEAAIFDAHRMMLDDPMLAESVSQRIDAGLIVEKALVESIEEIASTLAAMEDEYFAARAADVRDVGFRLLRILLGVEETSLLNLQQPSIIAAQDLTPSDTARLSPQYAIGFCTAVGGLTSHTAILARTLGIPAVVGLGKDFLGAIKNNRQVILDGVNGRIILDPEQQTRQRYRNMIQRRNEWQQTLQAKAHEKACTASGRRVDVGANIGDVETARLAVASGAEGVGLLRTEFLYLQDTRPPSEGKQIQTYRKIFETLAPRPVIVRTLDIGGDKPPSYIQFPDELNPFLGWRAIRIGLDMEELLKTQLRAILRAAPGHNVLIMYPMICCVEELERANKLLQQVMDEMTSQDLAFARDIPIGIMIETPAAAMIADLLAEHCDFLSIGTNDLTQYTLAVDRTNERVAKLFQPLHPAILRLIRHTIDAGHKNGIWVGMCGELAGMLSAIPILLGFGLDEFSMAPSSIAEAKWLIGSLSDEQAAQIARAVLEMRTASEIEAYMKDFLEKLLPKEI
jgi:phosphotransferase system enzyme I (PtsI)